MKKYISLILTFTILVLGVCSCSVKNNYTSIAIENSQEIAEGIRTAMMNRTFRFKITFSARTLDEEGIIELADELMNMSLYESDAPDAGDYLRYQYGGYTLTYSEEKGFLKYKYLLKITPEYYTNADEEAVVDELVEEAILNSGLDENSTDYEKILWTHNFICDTVSYDTVHKHTPGSGHIQSTAYSALYYHTALCQGYAVLCYRLLKELGVDNRIVTGTATVSGEQQRHAWNIVKLDGSYYNLDVTMDDVDSAYDYFLKTDEIFDKNHTRDEKYSNSEFYSEYPMGY